MWVFDFCLYGYYGLSSLARYVSKIQVYVYAHDFACTKVELHECYDLMVKDLMVKFKEKNVAT